MQLGAEVSLFLLERGRSQTHGLGLTEFYHVAPQIESMGRRREWLLAPSLEYMVSPLGRRLVSVPITMEFTTPKIFMITVLVTVRKILTAEIIHYCCGHFIIDTELIPTSNSK